MRLGVYVATAGEPVDFVKIADAASELLRGVLGTDRLPARLVFGVGSLPFGTPVELETIFEVTV